VAEDPATVVATTAEEEVVATGAEAMATLVATPLGGNSVQRNCVCFWTLFLPWTQKSNISSVVSACIKKKGSEGRFKTWRNIWGFVGFLFLLTAL